MAEGGNILKLNIYITFQQISTAETRGKYFQNVNIFKKRFFSSQASKHRYRCDFPRLFDVVLVYINPCIFVEYIKEWK